MHIHTKGDSQSQRTERSHESWHLTSTTLSRTHFSFLSCSHHLFTGWIWKRLTWKGRVAAFSVFQKKRKNWTVKIIKRTTVSDNQSHNNPATFICNLWAFLIYVYIYSIYESVLALALLVSNSALEVWIKSNAALEASLGRNLMEPNG